MKSKKTDKRIIALEMRESQFGYAVFEGSQRLLDWGATSRYPLERSSVRSQRRFCTLLRLISPHAVVVKGFRKRARPQSIPQLIHQECALRSIPVISISAEEFRESFGTFSVRNKHDVADVLTKIFPDLSSHLPRRRQPWQSEAQIMMVFDAVAAGFAFWQRDQNKPHPPN